MLQVIVNATSANVCVGFDTLGIALDLNNTFTFKKSDSFSFKGFDSKYIFEDNLVYTSYIKVFKKLNKTIVPVEISFKGDIPISRGLGSSSSLIVAGIVGANYYLNNILSKDEMLEIASQIEGHPDNVAPAIYGGLVSSFVDKEGKYRSINYPINDRLKFIVIIPEYMVSTKEARGVLPKKLDYKSIVSNLSRIANIPYAFKVGDIDLLYNLFLDYVHEPYRKTLINDYDRIKEIANKRHLPMAISGSGSTMLIISDNLDVVKDLKEYNVKTLNIGFGYKVKEI